MQISKDKLVSIEYTLKDSDGNVIDTNVGEEPLEYVQGYGLIVPGLESFLEGKDGNQTVSVVVPPEEGYGERDEDMVFEVDREDFEGEAEIEIGMVFNTIIDGDEIEVTVVGINDDEVTVDANHELAGESLHFEVKIVEVRDATSEEIEQAQHDCDDEGCCH